MNFERFKAILDSKKTKDNFETIVKICERAEAMGIGVGDRMTKIMDMEVADYQFKMRMEDFLNADALDFSHDFCGIQAHIDREEYVIGDLFLPRFATPERCAE